MQIDVIGVPIDLGADRRGVDMGASAIRYAQLEPALEALGYAVSATPRSVAVRIRRPNPCLNRITA